MQFVLSYNCDLSEGKDGSDVQNGTMINCHYMLFLVRLEQFWSMESIDNRNLARGLSACKDHRRFMSSVTGMEWKWQ